MKLLALCVLLTICAVVVFRINDHDAINAITFVVVGMCTACMAVELRGF